MYRLTAVLAGAFTAVMVLMNGELALGVGVYGSSVLAHLTGLIGALAVYAVWRPAVPGHGRVGPLALVGGASGALTVVMASQGLMVLGVPLTLALGLLGQTIASVVLDHYGILGVSVVRFSRARAGAMSLICLGIAATALA